MFNVIYSIMDTFVLVFFALLFCCRPMAPSTTTSFTLRSILEKDKLNGTNYTDWIHNMRNVLRVEKKEDVLDTQLLEEPADDATTAVKNAYKKA
jgi:hypothetical protein